MNEDLQEIEKRIWDYYDKDELDKAKNVCNLLIKDYPQQVGGYYILGIICYEERKYNKSVEYLNKALEIDNSNSVNNKSGGWICYWLGMNYSANEYNPMVEKKIMNNHIYDYNKAINYFEKSIEYDEYPEDSIYKIIFEYRKDYFKLNNLLRKAITKFPKKINFIFQYCNALLTINKKNEAVSLLIKKSVELESPDLYFKLAELYFQDANYEKAILNYELTLKKYNGNDKISLSCIFYSIAKSYYKIKKFEKSIEYFKKSFDFSIENNLDTEKEYTNYYWIYSFGIIASLGCLKKNNEINDYINSLPFSENCIDGIDIELLFWLSDEPADTNIEIYLKENSAIFKQLIKTNDRDFKEKISWLQFMLGEIEDIQELKLEALRNIVENNNTHQKILDKLSEEYYLNISKGEDCKEIISSLINDLKNSYSFRKDFDIYKLEEIIITLFANKEYKLIIDLKDNFTSEQLNEADSWFNIAYSYHEVKDKINAQKYYEYYMSKNKNSAPALNNLANIYSDSNEITMVKKAIKMYEKAIRIDKNDNLYEKNLTLTKEKLSQLIKEKDKNDFIEKLFKDSVKSIKKEDYFTLESLYHFILSIKKEDNFIDNRIAIQDEYFAVLMNVNPLKSSKLKDAWITNNYIYLTDEYDDYNTPIYIINPYIEKEIKHQKAIIVEKGVPIKWLEGVSNLSISRLEEIQYFDLSTKISKINKKYNLLIDRDFKELIFNYLIGNIKSTIVLSGSFMELILTYYIERKKISQINYSYNARGITKNLYDCNLFDLISFIEEKGYFNKDFYHLTNLSRIYRNFIHPGLELKNELTKNKSDLCFISTMEIFKIICN